MIETPLLCQGTNFIISPPEITDEDALKKGPQDIFDRGRTPAFGDELITEILGGETPQPMGDSIKPPASLICIKDGACGDLLPNVFIERS